jgi:hypothetical protein
MVHLPRRHFFQSRNEKHWSKEKKMGGPEYRILTQEEINGYKTINPVQESIDALNAAIDRLDKIINEMGQNNGTNNKPR